jgi:ankyrin repeat protein
MSVSSRMRDSPIHDDKPPRDLYNLSLIVPPREYNLNTLFRDLLKDRNLSRAERLLSVGANINYKDERGDTPLIAIIWQLYPSWEVNLRIVEFLVNYGADVNSENNEGMTPLSSACLKGDRNLIDFLVKRGATIKT